MSSVKILLLAYFCFSCVNEVDIVAEPKKDTLSPDFYYTLEQAEKEFGIKMHEDTASAFLKAKKKAEEYGERFIYKEPSSGIYFQFRPLHRACISSYVNYKTQKKVRSFEISHKDLLGKPRDEYISDLIKLYGAYVYHFRKDHEKNPKEFSERFFWPAKHGGVELEYYQRKKRKGNNIEFTCTVKLMDHKTLIHNVDYLSSLSSIKILKTNLIFNGYPKFEVDPTLEGNLYLTLGKIEKRFGVKLNDDAESSFVQLRKIEGYRPKKSTRHPESWIYLFFDKNYKANFNAKQSWHLNRKIDEITVKHSKGLNISRLEFLQKLKNIYGEFSYAHISEYKNYYSVSYLWRLPNGCGLRYDYFSTETTDPHSLTFQTNYAFHDSYNAHINYDLSNKRNYR